MQYEFPHILSCHTPDSWVVCALENIDVLLNDHAICEKKAALAAISLLSGYPYYKDILDNMSKLAREELMHFDMVIKVMKKMDIPYKSLKPSNYATILHKHVAKHDPNRLLDLLMVAAFIEARSYERFITLIPRLPVSLSKFYQKFAYAEYRHYQLYITIASGIFLKEKVNQAILFWQKIEQQAICSHDSTFRFHSGIPLVTPI